MFSRLQKIICMIMVLALGMSAASTAMAMSIGAVINASSVRVYQSASTSSRSVTLSKGTTVTVTAVSGGWARITKNGKTAYVDVKYLTTTSKYPCYTNQSVAVYKGASTSSGKLGTLSVNTKVYAVGVEGGFYRVQNSSGSVTGYVAKSALSKNRVSVGGSSGSSSSWKSKVKKLDWGNGGNAAFPRGTYATIYDIDTGITVRIKRMGGLSHADVEPATKADTAALLKIAGGEFSWKVHSVILAVGDKYIACSINTMPHGQQTITDNGYNGQFCLHMLNSATHGGQQVSEAHQTAIRRAYNWAH